MKEKTRNYIELIDELRRECKFTVEDLCSNICNPRHYRRIMSGERNINHELISKFCDKFSISDSDFYYNASLRDRTELKKIYSLYDMIYTHEYSNFFETVSKININNLISNQNKKFLQFCILKAYYVHAKKNEHEVLDDLYELMDYPKSLKKETFDFVDIHILALIADLQIKFKDDTALNKLIEILQQKRAIFVSSESSHVIASVYANTSLFLLRLKRFLEANSIATKGLEHSQKHNDVSALPHLHYAKSYSNFQVGKQKEAEIDAVRCLSSSIAKNNSTELQIFFNEFKNLFNINPFSLFKKYDNDLIK